MTAIQICALIGIFIALAILYWTGYRGGLIDGRNEGIEEGKAIQQSDNSETIRGLEMLAKQWNDHYESIYARYTRALEASKLGEVERQTLLAIAEKLRIAAETFSAFRTGKKLERDSLTLRDQALAMAALLDPAVPKLDAAEVNRSITEPTHRLTPQAAGTLQQHAKATKDLRALTRYNEELARQLKALIGYEALRQLHKATDNALLLADLVKEAA